MNCDDVQQAVHSPHGTFDAAVPCNAFSMDVIHSLKSPALRASSSNTRDDGMLLE